MKRSSLLICPVCEEAVPLPCCAPGCCVLRWSCGSTFTVSSFEVSCSPSTVTVAAGMVNVPSLLGRRIQVKVSFFDEVRTPLMIDMFDELDWLGPERISKSAISPTRNPRAPCVLIVYDNLNVSPITTALGASAVKVSSSALTDAKVTMRSVVSINSLFIFTALSFFYFQFISSYQSLSRIFPGCCCIIFFCFSCISFSSCISASNICSAFSLEICSLLCCSCCCCS